MVTIVSARPHMIYSAYGSNLWTGRLRERVPSASPMPIARRLNHSLRFHKGSEDGSGKRRRIFHRGTDRGRYGRCFRDRPYSKAQPRQIRRPSPRVCRILVTVIDLDGTHHPDFMYAGRGEIHPSGFEAIFLVQEICTRSLPASTAYPTGTLRSRACAQ